MSRRRGITSSFGYAFEGIAEAFKNEPNFRIHLVITIVVLLVGWYFRLSQTEWTIIILTIAATIVLELINTAIEAVVDIASPKISRLAKIAKDVSAAAVLISALSAIIVGAIIFLPKLLLLLK